MDGQVNVILSPIAPIKTSTNILLPGSLPISSLPPAIVNRLFPTLDPHHLVLHHGRRLLPHTSSTPLHTLQNGPRDPVFVHVTFRLRGGKGGFGSQLRAQGGRMASRKRRG